MYQQQNETVLRGTVETIRYQNENGWTVATLLQPESVDEITIVGVMPGIAVGVEVQASGAWKEHARFGQQFAVAAMTTQAPTSSAGLAVYLEEIVNGIGPVLAERIVAHFGEETTAAMQDAERLLRVPGIGVEKAREIVKSWAENEVTRQAMQGIVNFVHEYGLPKSLNGKLFREYGVEAVATVQENPYVLVNLHGIGFHKADDVALKLGLELDCQKRQQAALEFTLREATNFGHCYLEREQLLHDSARLAGLITTQLSVTLDALLCKPVEQRDIIAESTRHYTKALYRAEIDTAQHLLRLLKAEEDTLSGHDFSTITDPDGVTLTETQRQAVRNALTQRVSIITGGPGTGKSTITRAIVDAAREHTHVMLCSPTGKAAKRLGQAAGAEAQTIHRLLGVNKDGGFIHSESYPLEAGLLIVDEVSMLDIRLARSLLRAVKSGAHVVLIGDIDQLPAVGPGNVLRDVITSNTVPVTVLTAIFRQLEGSQIISNAHAINNGRLPVYANGQRGDFYLFHADEGIEAGRWITELVSTRIPQKFNFSPADIQVLCPMHRGGAGVQAMNVKLQALLNPPSKAKPEYIIGERVLRTGDRVIQTSNDYDLQVFNGDVGIVTTIQTTGETEKRGLYVTFPDNDNVVRYPFYSASALQLAYALTIHKAQGSEFPVVIVPILTEHYIMLQRNLLYTAVTRARELVVLVGSDKAIAMAVKNNQISKRNTALAERLITVQKS